MIDPFASAPVVDEAQALPNISEAAQAAVNNLITPTQAPVVNVAPSSNSEVVVTLKGGPGFEAPWIVIHAANTEDAVSQLDGTMATLMEKAQNAAKHFRSLGGVPAAPSTNITVGAAPARALQPGQPAGSVEAPSWAPPKPPGCEDFVYVTKVKAETGKTWHAWMPREKGDARPAKFFFPPR